MRQVSQLYRSGRLEVVNVPVPTASRGSVVVDTTCSLISSGTERMIVDLARKSLLGKARERPDLVAKVFDVVRRDGPLAAFDAVRAKLDAPIPLGYSMAGRVRELGAGVQGFAVGDRVACAGAGFANHAEINAVPENLAVPIPDGVSDEEASFVTVGAIALHGVRLVEPTLGAVVAVIGLGLLGQLAVSLLAAHGCEVVAFDVDPAKVDRARARGAIAGGVVGRDDCLEIARAASARSGVDSVVITASSSDNAPLVLAGDIARDRARISVVGACALELPRKTYYEKELSVVVSRSYGPGRYDANYELRGIDYPIGYVRWTERRNLSSFLRAIGSKRIEVASLVTHRFAFSDAMSAYQLITGEKPEPHLAVLLNYPEQKTPEPSPRASSTVPRSEASIGVIGTGAFASAVLLPIFASEPAVRLTAVCSGRGLSAQHAAKKFNSEVAPNADAVLADERIQAVVISTRHDSHARLASRALRSGKHVFLEKPAALNEEQLNELEDAHRAATGGAFLMVGFNRRFAPFARAVNEAFAGRSAGLLMTARINAGSIPDDSWIHHPEEGGGRIIGECCHFIDLFAYWSGSRPIRVSCLPIGAAGGARRDDNVAITIGFADGSVGSLVYTSAGDTSVAKETYEVIGGGKIASIDNWRTLRLTARGSTKTSRALRADKGHRDEVRAFARAVRAGSASPIDWPTIMAVTRATFAIEVARRELCTVELADT